MYDTKPYMAHETIGPKKEQLERLCTQEHRTARRTTTSPV